MPLVFSKIIQMRLSATGGRLLKTLTGGRSQWSTKKFENRELHSLEKQKLVKPGRTVGNLRSYYWVGQIALPRKQK